MRTSCVLFRPDYGAGFRAALSHLARAAEILARDLEDRNVPVVPLPTKNIYTAMLKLGECGNGSGALIVYVGGHGIVYSGEHYTLLDTTPSSPSSLTALWTRQLARELAGLGRDVVLLVDTCFSGSAALGLQEALAVLADTPKTVRFGLVACCRAFETAQDGQFLDVLLGLLHGGPDCDITAWTPKDEAIRLGALVAELRAAGIPVTDVLVNGASELRIIPNLQPRDEPGRVHVKTRLRRISSGAEAHLLDRSEGFVGRFRLQKQIAGWLETETRGMFVVTGGPGTGKSALMGLLARQSAGDSTAGIVEFGPRVALGTFDVIIHARHKTVGEVRAELATLGVSQAATVLVDALDEAVAGEAMGIAAHLRSLARRSRVRVVVGSRRSPVAARGVGGHDPLLAELGPSTVADLDDLQDTRADIAELVRGLLTEQPGSPYAGHSVGELADEIATHTSPSFLFAQTAARWLAGKGKPVTEDPDWRQTVARFGVDKALGSLIDEDLSGRFQDANLVRVRDLLRAVAWAEGLGLPRYGIWPKLAEARSPSSARYDDADVTWALNEAGWYLTEAGEDGQTVYRLFHQALIDYFREQTRHGR